MLAREAGAPPRVDHQMQRLLGIALFGLLSLGANATASACEVSVPLKLDDVRYADQVVVGRISHYRIVRDMQFRHKMLADPTLSADERKFYSGSAGLISDYARFDIDVDEVLVGRAPHRMTVTWDASTFAEPDTMPAGPFLIALRTGLSTIPPLRGPSGTHLPNPDLARPTVLQAACSEAFIFESASDQARKIRAILKLHRS